MKSKNPNSNGRKKKLVMESLEERRVLATLTPGFGVLPDTDLPPSVQVAFEQVSDLSQYSPDQLSESDWVVRLNEGHSTFQLAADLRLRTNQFVPTDLIDRTFVIERSAGYTTIVDKLANNDAIEYFYPLVNLTRSERLTPNDTLFDQQWHLENTGQTGGLAGEDANITSVWDNFDGEGVVIGIVDDGLDGTHPDLNFREDLSFDYGDNDADASPEDPLDDHGTAVAGVAAAIGNNNIGVTGAAFNAEVAGIRLLTADFGDAEEAGSLSHLPNDIDIYNNSWGPADIGIYAGSGPLATAAILSTATTGRGGLGGVLTWAAGNGLLNNDNSNYDGYANSPYTIAVTAINHNGQQSFYAEPGANILVAAQSNEPGIVTTDLVGNAGVTPFTGAAGDPIPDDDPSNYRDEFGGTSSATPLASGIIALMLDANPNLTYRDIQHILVQTARRNDTTDNGWSVNAAGLDINHKYGFGAIDAEAAVEAAITWTTVAPEVVLATDVVNVNQAIPDNNLPGTQFTITVPETGDGDQDFSNFQIEHARLRLVTDHTFRGDLRIELTSPSGTSSILATQHIGDFGDLDWIFDTVRTWGESVVGDWVVNVSDRAAGETGMVNDVQLIFNGTGTSLTEDIDIVITPPIDNGVITGTVFDDVDNDGFNDASEDGLAGHTVFLDANNNGLLDPNEETSVTGSTGNYFFTQLPIGTYTVGYICNTDGPEVVRACDVQTGVVGLAGISSGNDFASSVDCLPFDGGGGEDTITDTAIEGIFFNDIDGDGEQDVNEAGIPGMTVYADLNNNCVIGLGEPAAITDANGHYSLAVAEGTYFLRSVPRPGLQLSACQGVSVTAPGDVIVNQNIAFAGDDEFDYGSDGGAEHGIYPGFKLGNLVSSDATVDDNDGVIFSTGLNPGATEEILVIADKVAVSTAYLHAWIDWNGDNDFADAGEQIFSNLLLQDGLNRLSVNVPANANTRDSGVEALFRYGFEQNLTATAPALSGEAESYRVTIPSEGTTGINAVDDIGSVAAGASVTIDALANDMAGPLGGDLTLTDVSSPNAVINADGTITFTPAADATANESFTYTVIDSLGGTDTATVSVEIILNFPVAADDQASVLISSEATEIDVLANDVDDPAHTMALTVSLPQTSTAEGGTISISPDASTILYTPLAGFEGTDTFSYTAINEDGDTDTGTVSVSVISSGPLVEVTLVATDLNGNPIEGSISTGQAFQLQGFVEDLRDVPQGVFSSYLDVVLDQPGLVTLGEITYGDAYTNNTEGTVTSGLIDEVGAQGDIDPIGGGQFHLFTVSMVAVSEGTLNFTANPADILPANETSLYELESAVPDSLITFVDESIVIERAARVDFIFDVVDTSGMSIESIAVGQNFSLNISVEDLTPEQMGVFSAYLDVLYDSTRVIVDPSRDITFGPGYTTSQFGITTTSGEINELGAANESLTAIGGGPFLLASIPLTATANGTVTFTGNIADDIPPRETLLYGNNDFVDERDMRFSTDSITIGNAAASLSRTYSNSQNPHDVSGDGNVTPMDVLMVVNDLNRNGARALPTLSSDSLTQSRSVRPQSMVDVNNDGFASPIDALMVINELNQPSTRAQAALSSVAFAAEAEDSEDESSSSTDQVLSVWSSFDSNITDDADDDWVVEIATATVGNALDR